MGAAAAAARRHPVRLATAISALLSAVYLLWQPQSLDLAAQTFRADLWARDGWVIWNDAWYSGHPVPGYSLLFPPLGALLGPELLGAICAVASAALFATIAFRAYGERAWLGCAWFGAASTVALYGGRITFGLGLVLGLAAMLGLQRRRTGWGAAAGALAGLASPVAGLFTAMAAAAVAVGSPSRRRSGLAIAAVAMAATLLLALAFPTDGHQPFTFSSWVWIPLVALGALLLLPADERVLRWGVLLYAALGIAAFVLTTPLGGNAVRLGTTFAGPVLALALFGRRPLALALVALPLLWWQWTATVRDVAAAEGDPSTEAAYYAPLLSELDRVAGREPIRVEVPATRSRWEAVYVAERYPLARGWLRQLEAEDFGPFIDGVWPTEYERWLLDKGVSYVALSDAEPDGLAADEVELLRGGELEYLREIWSNEHWRLFELRDPGGLADGGAEITALHPDGFSVRVPGPGDYLLRLRYSPYFSIESGDACLEASGADSTRLSAAGAGPQTIEVSAGLSVSGLLRDASVCSG